MINSSSIESLTPKTKMLLQSGLSEAKDNGINVKVISTKRDSEYQNYLYSLGRSKAGNIVTNARGGESYHEYGDAFDTLVYVNGKPSNNKNDYIKLAEIFKRSGLAWGGDFKNINDYGHFQRKNKETDKKINDSIIKNGSADQKNIIPFIIVSAAMIFLFKFLT